MRRFRGKKILTVLQLLFRRFIAIFPFARLSANNSALFFFPHSILRVLGSSLTIGEREDYGVKRIALQSRWPIPRLLWHSKWVIAEVRTPFECLLSDLPAEARATEILKLWGNLSLIESDYNALGVTHGDLWVGNVAFRPGKLPLILDVDPRTLGHGAIGLDLLTLVLHNPTGDPEGRRLVRIYLDGFFESQGCHFGAKRSQGTSKELHLQRLADRWVSNFSNSSGWLNSDLLFNLEEPEF